MSHDVTTPHQNPYDEIPYTKNIYKQTHPPYLATLATLFSLHPPTVTHCRVLELGCARGLNLLAMAQTLPESTFIGVDASYYQIEEAKNHARLLNSTNVTFKQIDITDIEFDLGLFDYIVAHGVYSWVSPAVQDKLFQVCQRHLSPNGLVYVSYNTLPGWCKNSVLRDLIRYYTRKWTEPKKQLAQARQLLQFLEKTLKGQFDAYSLALKKELEKVNQLSNSYLFHEYLEENNTPVFFHDFIAQAQRWRLQYVTDSDIALSLAGPDQETIAALQLDAIEQEQCIDFLQDNTFRESILCHEHHVLKRSHTGIEQFYIAAPIKLDIYDAPLTSETPEVFYTLSGQGVLSISCPLLKSICVCLGEAWPQSLSFEQVMQNAYEKLASANTLKTPQAADIDEAKVLLLDLFLKKIVEFSIYPPRFTLAISNTPLVNPLARLQNQWDDTVANLRYEYFSLDMATRYLLDYLDGEHDQATLVDILNKAIQQGQLNLPEADRVTPSHYLDKLLQQLAEKAFFIA